MESDLDLQLFWLLFLLLQLLQLLCAAAVVPGSWKPNVPLLVLLVVVLQPWWLCEFG